MLEISYGLTFFLKSPKSKSELFRYVYVRITVDGVPKETSTKRKWDMRRWDQNLERAIGTKEDARSLNFFLDSLQLKVDNFKTELVNTGKTIIAARIIEFIKGNEPSKAKVLEEFQTHNDELQALVEKKEFAKGTHTRYVTARSHVQEFIFFKYKRDDLEFRELNYEFVTDYMFYLKTVRNCSNNTSLKYISNFKKIVLRAIAKELILQDPFKLFKSKKTKIKKKPLTRVELQALENKEFQSDRLSTIRDIFVFQCYTGLAYIDAYQLKKTDIKEGNDGRLWIMSSRQKSKSNTDIPLLPKALEILNKYKDNPLCISRGSILPVKSNQKMNEYLKEIATLCGINTSLNTHKARRTFASTITLNNGVPINVVKEMLGHHSVKQTEDYAITEQETISREMIELNERLSGSESSQIENEEDIARLLKHLNKEFVNLKLAQHTSERNVFKIRLAQFEASFKKFKADISKVVKATI
ncbi:site-specific integrase [Chryseobacterium paludis]|uniref:site-specific integrase n=1 Tax=Chryseobacterium paludis TaxID=2956784 RepID=UPI0021C1E321|nr:site-specific integrase [Chryseobacterium paludis]